MANRARVILRIVANQHGASMMAAQGHERVEWSTFAEWARAALGPDRPFLTMALIYGAAIGLLSLATPISVQMLINSVANTALPAPLFTLAGVLLALLLLWAFLGAMRIYVMEMFRRRVFARIVAEITLQAVHAQNPFFQDDRRGDLFNRFFEVMNVQKAIPSLLVGGFSIFFQAMVGFIVTSFYHPVFLGFNLAFIFTVWLIWKLWARRAMESGIALSHRKYETAHWLESVGASNGFYKSSRHLDYAMDMSENRTAAYVEAHANHFGATFPQAVALLLLYAIASAVLLAMGGWLVIQGQLSIGQLVAAELILSSIFYGAAQLGPYLDTFYDLVAAVEELSLFRAITLEDVPTETGDGARPRDGALALRQVWITADGEEASFDLVIPAGAHVVAAADPGVDRLLARLLKRHYRPDVGIVSLGDADISALNIYQLRSDVIVLDRPTIVESSIRDYLRLADPTASSAKVLDALELVGLGERITRLPLGLDSLLSSTGWPLSVADTMRLKLAGAILARPQLLILSNLFDMLPSEELRTALHQLDGGDGGTIIVFTARPDALGFDHLLWLGRTRQLLTQDPSAFAAARGGDDAISR